MKLVRCRLDGQGESLGVLLASGDTERLMDVPQAGAARGVVPPATMMDLIAAGERGLDTLRELTQWSAARGHGDWLRAQDQIEWLTPVPPRSCFAAGRNFGAHKLESIRGNPVTTKALHSDFPTGFVKLGRTLVPNGARVRRPPDVTQMDYEVEIAVIVSAALECASVADSRAAIFGYTVFNDLSAREWQLSEMKNNLLMLGKNFPGFGPLGPCILTADEVPDPGALRLWLKVNGEMRQDSDCRDLIFGFDELVSFWSRMGLQPGDIVCTGTPEGVALHRKPDPGPFFLKPGDRVEAGVDQIGVLETHII
ncbi:MAG: fumarylacetoacetate hydrolase family protein [Burkholderiaceae bacterium]|nr:fumarylacetoacetate hydrolase family protein [Burkholderiaceae bacterium]